MTKLNVNNGSVRRDGDCSRSLPCAPLKNSVRITCQRKSSHPFSRCHISPTTACPSCNFCSHGSTITRPARLQATCTFCRRDYRRIILISHHLRVQQNINQRQRLVVEIFFLAWHATNSGSLCRRLLVLISLTANIRSSYRSLKDFRQLHKSLIGHYPFVAEHPPELKKHRRLQNSLFGQA